MEEKKKIPKKHRRSRGCFSDDERGWAEYNARYDRQEEQPVKIGDDDNGEY
jgi:hypothetical protein